MRKIVLLVMLLVLVGCYAERDPSFSRVGSQYNIHEDAIIVLADGRRVYCGEAKQIDVGWECWNDNEAEHEPRAWYRTDEVVEVNAVLAKG